jgi:hypothetical protein
MSALVRDCETLLEPMETQLRPFEDRRSSLETAYEKAREKIIALPSYAIAKEAFEQDEVFGDGPRKAGRWATFDQVFQHIIASAARVNKKSVSIDHAQVLRNFRSYRDFLTSPHLRYGARARLFGVKLVRKSLTLPDGVTIHRLNAQEINERQPIVQAFVPSGLEELVLDVHRAELRVRVTVPVDQSEDGALFKAHNAAEQGAREIFARILRALLVTFSGEAVLGNIELTGGFEQMLASRSFLRGFPWLPTTNLRLRDIKNISVAYGLVSSGTQVDKTLSRALHRFVLGRQRRDLVDKLVDYVIAWEAILLTNERKAITQELSYRFALNGASILSVASKANPKPTFRKMRSAYSTRSAIVHGGDDAKRDKELRAGDFKNLQELCDFLESNFRRVVFWLSALDQNARPYRAKGGWEALIWSRH